MVPLKSIIRQGKQTRSDLKQLGNSGRIPVAVYGYGTKSTSARVDEVESIKVIREVGRNGVIDLGVGSKTVKVMVSDCQFDPLKNQITHIDFLAINMNEERTAGVQVQLVGEAVGAKEGSVVKQPLFSLEVTAAPENIPETIEIDISELQASDSLAISGIRISGDFTIGSNPEDSIVTVVPLTDEPSEEEVEAMKGGSTAEGPEVVDEDKEDDKEESKED